MRPLVYLLCDDLVWSSRLAAGFQAAGAVVRVARDCPELLRLAGEAPAACVVLDLTVAGPSVADLVRHLRRQSTPPYLVAYGPHVDTQALTAARDAGCDLVVPRSKLAELVREAAPVWLARSERPDTPDS